MQLNFYRELQNGKGAIVELDDTQLDDRNWNHCLVGYFLDGKMPFALLSSTARAVWKDHGQIRIKQFGSCFYFEFQDEATKIKVLEGGPYFFSRRYLVLKDWRRMLIPSPEHPSSIPAWVKVHKLPLECWTADGLSRIASTVGRPLHVDKATENQQRIDFARICIEVSAEDDLPDEIQIVVKGESVMVHVEYQWLPTRCAKCKVFGHSCAPKPGVKASTSNSTWQVVGKPSELKEGAPQLPSNQQNISQELGKGHQPPSSDEVWERMGKALGGGGGVLETISKVVPNATWDAFIVQLDGAMEEDSLSEASEILADDCPLSMTQPGITAITSDPISSSASDTAAAQSIKENVTNFADSIKPTLNPHHKPPNPPSSTEVLRDARTIGEFGSSSSKKKGRKQNRGNPKTPRFSGKH